MKPNHLSFLLSLCVFSLILAACNKSFNPDALPTVEIVASDTAIPVILVVSTSTPAPTTLPTPTQTPPPIHCTISFESNRDGNLKFI